MIKDLTVVLRLYSTTNSTDRYGYWWRLLAILSLFIHPIVLAGEGNLMMTITAEVFGQPCSIRPGDEIISVDFGNIAGKVLNERRRTPSKIFNIHLDGCETTIANSIKVTFSGLESEDPMLLALSNNSTAKGIAIGLEKNGHPLPINRPIHYLGSIGENNILNFSAYLQLLPSAQLVTPGIFNATAIFTLDYD